MTDEIRKRLSELNRGRLKSGPSSRALDWRESDRPVKPLESNTGFIDPPDELPGQELETEYGKFLLIRRDLSDIWRAAERFVSHYYLVFNRGAIGVELESLHQDLRRFCELDHLRLLYLDIETCGLSAAPVFLVGFLYLDGGRMVIDQLLARDYSEEAPLLHYFWDSMSQYDSVVTFNGKSFDVPFLRDRAVYHGVPHQIPEFHFDLLHEARRRWKGEFPNCKLQTLEARLCGRLRRGDIPSSLIPRAYHDFVRTKDTMLVRDIIHHNALDIVTMSEVLLRLISGV